MGEEPLEKKVSELEENIDKTTRRFHRVRERVRTSPEVFGFDDMAQQIIGASLLSSPFCMTEEVWRLAASLHEIRLIAIMILSVVLGIILIYFTDYQRVADDRRFGQYVPVRIISLVCISYGMVTIILYVLGIFEYGMGHGFGSMWRIKVVILVGFFGMLGGAVADVVR